MNELHVSLLLGCLLLLQGAAGQRFIRRDGNDQKKFASVAIGPYGELLDDSEELEEPSGELLDNSEELEAEPADDDGDDTEGAEDPEEAYQEHGEEVDKGTASVDADVDRVPEGYDAKGPEGDIDGGADDVEAYEEREDLEDDQNEEGATAEGEAGRCHHGNPAEASRKYSGVWRNSKSVSRSQIDSKSAWCANSRFGKGAWMQMTVPKGEEFAGVITQGRKNSNQWVTKYMVKFSTDGTKWSRGWTWTGNIDKNSKVYHRLNKPTAAKYVRIYTLEAHNHACMRAGLMLCKAAPKKAKAPAVAKAPAQAQACKTQVANAPEKFRKYSSVYNNEKAGTGHAQSMLDSALAWCASGKLPKHSWMSMPLPKGHKLAGIVTQGRKQHDQWVTKYTVIYHDGKKKKWYKAGKFTGNTDRTTKVTHMLKTPVSANWVRIYPTSVKNHLCMRAGLVVCKDADAEQASLATGPPGSTGGKGPTGPSGPPGPPGPPGPCAK